MVLEVDSDAGLKAGARLTVNVAESPRPPENKHDLDMEELTAGKMYAHFHFRF